MRLLALASVAFVMAGCVTAPPVVTQSCIAVPPQVAQRIADMVTSENIPAKAPRRAPPRRKQQEAEALPAPDEPSDGVDVALYRYVARPDANATTIADLRIRSSVARTPEQRQELLESIPK